MTHSSQRHDREWDAYLAGQPGGLFTQRHGYARALAATYGHPAVFLRATSVDGVLRGVLPLLLFAVPGREKRLLSLPFSDAAGMVADQPQAAGDLLREALALAARRDCAHLELRQYDDGAASWLQPEALPSGWSHEAYTFKIGLCRDLPASACTLWGRLPDKVRNQVRKARRHGATVRVGGSELLADFYAVFAENMRDLGSPVHDPRLFARLLGDPSLEAAVLVVDLGGRAAAAAVVFIHEGTMSNPWASSRRPLRPYCVNMLLYWAMLELAIARGCGVFDFGRSTADSPAHRFKGQWGAKTRPLSWHVFSRRGAKWRPELERLADPRWQGLDLGQANLKGPLVRRFISL